MKYPIYSVNFKNRKYMDHNLEVPGYLQFHFWIQSRPFDIFVKLKTIYKSSLYFSCLFGQPVSKNMLIICKNKKLPEFCFEDIIDAYTHLV